MAPTNPADKPAAASPAGKKDLKGVKVGKVAKKTPGDGKKRGKAHNYNLGCGVYRFSKSKTYHKKAKYKFVGKKNPKPVKPKKPTTVEKQIGGEKNGGTRIVRLKKGRNYYPTTKRPNKHPTKKRFSQHKRYTRKNLEPGRICILLAGKHKGKRVVLLKVLKSGLLLVTGPYRINGCPIRRVSQNFVIATKTRLNVRSVKVPDNLDDKYFKRIKPKKQKKEEGDIFATKKEGYKVSDQRKSDQSVIDKAVIEAIKKRKDKGLVVKYLKAMFGLKKTQYPHRIKF